jgi:hypothetical protein
MEFTLEELEKKKHEIEEMREKKKDEKIKIEDIDCINSETGEAIDSNMYINILKNDRNKKNRKLFYFLEKYPEKLTLEDMIEIRKIMGKSKNIKLDFSNDGYCVCKNDINKTLELSEATRAMLYCLSQMITYDGRLKYANNKIISSIEDLKKYLSISNGKWNRYIRPEIEKYNILKKEKIDNKTCIILNPIYATKDRKVTETMFICFHDELKEYLDFVDYLYLKKIYEIEL